MVVVLLQIFRAKKMPKEKALCKCLSIITLDSFIKAKKKCYPQTLLEECKYEQEKIKMENLTDDDLEICLSDKSDFNGVSMFHHDSTDETEYDDDDESNK